MKKYCVVDELNDYEQIEDFETIEDAKRFIKNLKQFDKREKNPFKTKYEIYKIEEVV